MKGAVQEQKDGINILLTYKDLTIYYICYDWLYIYHLEYLHFGWV